MSNDKSIKLVKKIELTYHMELLTGLHIGAGKDNVEIGGIDNPVVRARLKNNQPYIPGSSIKGKLRSLLEIAKGVELGRDAQINKLFGITGNNAELSRLIVRDAYLTKDSVEKLDNVELDMPYTEAKYENSIDRIKGTAKDPRQMERVPAGAVFEVNFVLNIYQNDNENELINLLNTSISLLEKDYLGGSGTRGYGQVKFKKIKKEGYEINEEKGELRFQVINNSNKTA